MSVSFFPQERWDIAEVNVANANAMSIFATMQIEAEDLVGDMDAETFMGHVLTGLATCDDTAWPPSETKIPNGPTLIDCGRREGYMTDVLSRLLDVATHAKRLGVPVVWG